MPEAHPHREAELRTSRDEAVEATIKAKERNKKVVDQRQSTSTNFKVNDVIEIQIVEQIFFTSISFQKYYMKVRAWNNHRLLHIRLNSKLNLPKNVFRKECECVGE